MEAHRGQESFIGFLRSELNDKISTVETWNQFHAVLAALNVSIKLKGNGFVFENADGLTVKASSVNRAFSKASLEKNTWPLSKQSLSNSWPVDLQRQASL